MSSAKNKTQNKICPISYDLLKKNEEPYALKSLKLISPKLNTIKPFPYSAADKRSEATLLASKISIQGVQPKLSAKLNIKNSCFEIVAKFGKYILKPQTDNYPELPQNESLTMKMAEAIGIEVPLNGLIVCADNSWTYFIKRMDRSGHSDKVPLEDFAQLAEKSRDTKYDYTVEKIIALIEKYTTFPQLEKRKFYKRFLFNYIVGNEDMHLKNYSLITRHKKIELSPAYDLVNSTIVLGKAKEESALPFNGKKNNFTAKDLLRVLPERLGLNSLTTEQVTQEIQNGRERWSFLLENCFLSDTLNQKYKDLVNQRLKKLAWTPL